MKERVFYKFIKNFGVIDLRTSEKVWSLPDCEQVFYKGTNAADLDLVNFEDRKIKLRTDEEPETEWESEDEDGPRLVLEENPEEEEPDSDEAEDHTDLMQQIHKGIMVIKSVEEEVVIKPETPKGEDKKEDDAEEAKGEAKPEGEDAEAVKDKKVLRKFLRAYYPKWKGEPDQKKRLFYETFVDLKSGVQ